MGPKQTKTANLATNTIIRNKCDDALSELKRLYIIEDVPIAKGAFGNVYMARSVTDEDTLFAIKHLMVKDMEAVCDEVQILNSLDHPNIVKYYEIYQDK